VGDGEEEMSAAAMSAKEKKEPQSSQDPAAAPLGSVDQIRDIIFGAQMRDYEERFSALEARLIEEARLLREDVQNRFHALEQNLESERGERGAATDRLVAELQATARSIEARADKDRDEIQNQIADTRDAIMKRLDELQEAKTDRIALSELLRDMADELEGEAAFEAPAEPEDESTAPADDSGEPG
jgi:hypothetical protein